MTERKSEMVSIGHETVGRIRQTDGASNCSMQLTNTLPRQ